MDDASVCAVIVNWNSWADTLKCVRALRQVDYRDLRIVVVDNHSDDDSFERLQPSDGGYELLVTPYNLGFSGGCNWGIRHALAQSLEFVWLLNNDAVAAQDALRAMVATACADADVGAVGSIIYEMERPDVVQAWGGGWVSLVTGVPRLCRGSGEKSRMRYITGASILLRVAALRDVGLLDEGLFLYYDDPDICLRLERAGWRLAVAEDSRVWHRRMGTLGATNPKTDELMAASSVRFLCRYSRFPRCTIAINQTGKLLKRLTRPRHFLSVVCGTREGWRKQAQFGAAPFWRGGPLPEPFVSADSLRSEGL